MLAAARIRPGFFAATPAVTVREVFDFRVFTFGAAVAAGLPDTALVAGRDAEAGLGRDVLTMPFMTFRGIRAFAATFATAFILSRPDGLLRGLEAMGTTLGTVETR